jgi:enediyne biosynthesis protein E4
MRPGWRCLLAFGCGLAVGLLGLGLAGFWPRGQRTAGSPQVTLIAPAAPVADWDPALGSPPRFTDVTMASGIDFRHDNGMSGKFLYPEIMGAGVALLDYDGDGLLDVYFTNGNKLAGPPSPDVTNHLYHSNGDWTFTDVTAKARVAGTGYGQGCCAGDYDNDGDLDLYVSNLGPNILYRNDGDGTFTDVAVAAGVADPGWGQTCSFLDHDGDGWLDLYVQNYLTYAAGAPVEAVVYLGSRKILDYPTPLEFPGSASRLFRNRGNGAFEDATGKAGILRPGGKGMGLACVDFDDDGNVDIFQSNDGLENYYFHGRGGGVFEEIGLLAGVAFDATGIPKASMGVDVGDYDRDGRLDIVCPALRVQGFMLYRNAGTHFTDGSTASGVARLTAQYTGFSPNFLDYDNDGDLDLFFTTGGVRANDLIPEDGPFLERYGYPDLLLANDGAGRFTDVSSRAGPHFRELTIGRGSAAGDLDNDGDVDIVISNLAGRALVLRNDTAPGHWVTLVLKPRRGNRDALGASVWIDAGGTRQRASVHGAVSYLSQNDRRVHFGLGKAERIDRLEIRWPDGERQVLEGIAPDRLLSIEQGAGAQAR